MSETICCSFYLCMFNQTDSHPRPPIPPLLPPRLYRNKTLSSRRRKNRSAEHQDFPSQHTLDGLLCHCSREAPMGHPPCSPGIIILATIADQHSTACVISSHCNAALLYLLFVKHRNNFPSLIAKQVVVGRAVYFTQMICL